MVRPEVAGSGSEASPGRSRRRVTFKCRGCSHRSSLKFIHNILTFYNHMRALLILDLLDVKKNNFFPKFCILVKFELSIFESSIKTKITFVFYLSFLCNKAFENLKSKYAMSIIGRTVC
jgi:hypothetical protein